MKTWLYQGKEITKIEDFGENVPFGFIYVIKNNINGKIYIGKKQLYSVTNKKLGKKELANLPTQRGRKQTKKLVEKESNWLNYNGSNIELLEDIKQYGIDKFYRQILKLCYNKKELTYWEIATQCKHDVLFIDSYNDNINAKYFRRDFVHK